MSVEHGKYHVFTVTEEVNRVSATRTLRLKNTEVCVELCWSDISEGHEISPVRVWMWVWRCIEGMEVH